MVSALERKDNELWTGYLIRRLKEIGVKFETDIFTSDDLNELVPVINLEAEHPVNMAFYREFEGLALMRVLTENVLTNISLEQILVTEGVRVGGEPKNDDLTIEFLFSSDGVAHVTYSKTLGVKIIENPKLAPDDFFQSYGHARQYDSEVVIDDIVRYAELVLRGLVDVKTRDTPHTPWLNDKANQKLEGYNESVTRVKHDVRSNKGGDTDILDDILRTVRRIESRQAEHPISLKDEGTYLSHLYVQAINEDADNLQFFEYDGQRIPYVLVHSSDLEGKPGKPFMNLYLVARDKAPEDWQQRIVALHESVCVREGHEEAKRKELPLAQSLGKEDEYLAWREDID